MMEREVEPLMDKLREAETMVLSVIEDGNRRDCWRAAQECKILIWKAMEKAADMVRPVERVIP